MNKCLLHKNSLDWKVSTHYSISEISQTDWDSLVPGTDLFMQSEYLSILEKTCLNKSITPVYSLLFKGESLCAVAYFQIIDFNGSQLKAYLPATQKTKDSSFVKRKFSLTVGKVFDTLSLNVLSSGNFFTTGERCFYAIPGNENKESEWLKFVSNETLKTIQQTQKINLSLLSDFYENDLPIRDKFFQKSSFQKFLTEDEMQLKVQEDWQSFDDYLQALSSKYRVRTKKTYAMSSAIVKRRLYYNDIVKHIETLYDLYTNVTEKAKMNLGFISREYLMELAKNVNGRFHIYGYFLTSKIDGADEQLVGFTSIFIHEKTMTVHYIGLNYHANQNFNLYARMLYDDIQLAIEKGVSVINFGRTAQEIKSTVGAEPRRLKSYIKATSPILNHFMPQIVGLFKPSSWIQRQPFKTV